MKNWILSPVVVVSLSFLSGESVTGLVRRRGKAAQFWNITLPDQDLIQDGLERTRTGRSFPLVLDKTEVYPFPPGTIFSLFFEIAIRVFDYNEDFSQNMLLDFPVTYAVPFQDQGFRAFSTSRADVYEKLEGMIERLGLDGEACVNRLLCEVTAHPMVGGGLMGDLFNLIIRGRDKASGEEAKSSMRKEKERQYQIARRLGEEKACWKLGNSCPVSIFNIPLFNVK